MKMNLSYLFLFFVTFFTSSCEDSVEVPEQKSAPNILNTYEAVITDVKVSGEENNYTFNVTIKSPDTGCEQYADWWEVITVKGNLVYRRILAHSHIDEQPFSRSGGSVNINSSQEIYIRAHMNTSGYGTTVFGGTIVSGFKSFTIPKDFAINLVNNEPLPTGCAF